MQSKISFIIPNEELKHFPTRYFLFSILSFIIPNEELKYFPGQKKVTVIPDL